MSVSRRHTHHYGLILIYLDVTYSFTNRTPDMKLRRGAYKWLLQQVESKSLQNDAFSLLHYFARSFILTSALY